MSDKCPHHVRRNHACPICARISQALAESELGSRKGPMIESDELIVMARASAETWTPFTQNHDPSFQRALREAYVSGFQRGFRVAEAKQHNE